MIGTQKHDEMAKEILERDPRTSRQAVLITTTGQTKQASRVEFNTGGLRRNKRTKSTKNRRRSRQMFRETFRGREKEIGKKLSVLAINLRNQTKRRFRRYRGYQAQQGGRDPSKKTIYKRLVSEYREFGRGRTSWTIHFF